MTLSIYRLNTRRRHEQVILSVLRDALTNLIALKKFDEDSYEDDITVELINEIHKELMPVETSFTVVFDCKNQPIPGQPRDLEREKKRPDIQFQWVNHEAQSYMERQSEYIVECKRLRSGKTWNKDYVKKGIKRFIHAEHGYAKGSESAAMIGYIQNSEPDSILNDVNCTLEEVSHPPLVKSQENWIARGVARLYHSVYRTEILPCNFTLNHLWADMRRL
ncbi:hypothetical protein SPFL3102_02842 [Sporomusaceae bacterium FL31]|nr:hypothetical protein SPFL3101_01172 [Sporomusaceae bacterium FL31]GCE35014.1 hypothetical protein SPFL3102_02842 [Sporomusaceae bacterium]